MTTTAAPPASPASTDVVFALGLTVLAGLAILPAAITVQLSTLALAFGEGGGLLLVLLVGALVTLGPAAIFTATARRARTVGGAVTSLVICTAAAVLPLSLATAL
jgi:hypothetical protein